MYRVCLMLIATMMSFASLSFSINAKENVDMSKKPTSSHPTVLLKTSEGDIKIELDAVKAPNTVKNFLVYILK